jgi:beta-lactam-binding protein with PASTA domain
MKGFLQFLKTKAFFKHLLLASLTALLVLWSSFKMIGFYTDHGDKIKVPDFTGKSIKELDNFVKGKDVNYEIIDSLYAPEEKSGTVIRQEPEKDSEVKHNRTIYLYVTSTLPPQIIMPKLIDRSLRQATAMLESYGLKIGKVKFISDPCANCIIKQSSNGQEVAPGTQIKKGSVIDLVAGKGSGESEQVGVPNLIGMKVCEARSKLSSAALSTGAMIFDSPVKDTCNAYVYRQSPVSSADNTVNMGSSIDLYITTDKSKLNLLNGNTNNDGDDDGK